MKDMKHRMKMYVVHTVKDCFAFRWRWTFLRETPDLDLPTVDVSLQNTHLDGDLRKSGPGITGSTVQYSRRNEDVKVIGY
jgi:hypothetical protein